MDQLTQLLSQHKELVEAALVYALLAAGMTMPPKGSQWSVGLLYDWFYDWTHALMNHVPQSRRLASDPTNPTPPAGPAKE